MIQHPRRKRLLKLATRQLVSDFGGQVAAGKHMGKRHQRYSDVGLPNTADFMTIEEVGEFEDLTAGLHGHPVVTRALALRQGFLLVEAEDDIPDGQDWLTHIQNLSAEAGDITSDIAQALATGGDVTAEEIDKHDLEASAARLMNIAAAIYRTVEITKQD